MDAKALESRDTLSLSLPPEQRNAVPQQNATGISSQLAGCIQGERNVWPKSYQLRGVGSNGSDVGTTING